LTPIILQKRDSAVIIEEDKGNYSIYLQTSKERFLIGFDSDEDEAIRRGQQIMDNID